jgi:hypothetical protein
MVENSTSSAVRYWGTTVADEGSCVTFSPRGLAVVLKLVSSLSRSYPHFHFQVVRIFWPVLATWYIRSTMALLKAIDQGAKGSEGRAARRAPFERGMPCWGVSALSNVLARFSRVKERVRKGGTEGIDSAIK